MWVTAEEREIVKTPVGNEIPTKAPPPSSDLYTTAEGRERATLGDGA